MKNGFVGEETGPGDAGRGGADLAGSGQLLALPPKKWTSRSLVHL